MIIIVGDYHASMEPRSFNRGDIPDNPVQDELREASMEPRSFNRGDISRRIEDRRRSYGFNGATVV